MENNPETKSAALPMFDQGALEVHLSDLNRQLEIAKEKELTAHDQVQRIRGAIDLARHLKSKFSLPATLPPEK